MKTKKQLARGVWPLVEHGIRRYMAEHRRKPVALVLHATQMKAFCRQAGSDAALLNGVSVLNSPLFKLPVLLSEKGESFEL
jgi:hypothetical protein